MVLSHEVVCWPCVWLWKTQMTQGCDGWCGLEPEASRNTGGGLSWHWWVTMWVQMALSKYSTSSVGAMRRIRSATKAIQDFEGNVFLGCPIWAARP